VTHGGGEGGEVNVHLRGRKPNQTKIPQNQTHWQTTPKPWTNKEVPDITLFFMLILTF